MTKRTFVSGANYGPSIAGATAVIVNEPGQDSREAVAAKALGVELEALVRERPLSRTWRAKSAADGKIVAVVMVAEGVTAEERELFARMAEDVHAAGDALPGVLRAREVTPSRDGFLTDLWTAGTRDLVALKWPERRRVEFVLGVVRALDALHGLGLVHGALCAGNVLLDDDFAPVVAEAGSVPVHELVERGQDPALYAPFAAPEVLQGGKVDARSDVYSVGRILEEVTKEDEPSPALAEIVRRCLAADPAERYTRASDLAAAIEAVLGSLSDAETAQPPPVAAPIAPRPVDRERPARPDAPAIARPGKETPSLAWMPPRAVGFAGAAALVAALALSAAVGANDAVRTVLALAVAVGAALATTLLRPPAEATLKRGLTMQIALAGGCLALMLVLDPLSLGYRLAAQRHLRGDDASRHAAITEVLRLGRDFRGLSLANLDLSGVDFSGADLRGVDLSHATLARARLFGADVQGASFEGAALAGAMLDQVDLAQANVTGATCDGETRMSGGWRCSGGHVSRSPVP